MVNLWVYQEKEDNDYTPEFYQPQLLHCLLEKLFFEIYDQNKQSSICSNVDNLTSNLPWNSCLDLPKNGEKKYSCALVLEISG